MTEPQLTLDGREVDPARARATSSAGPPLTNTQHRILELARRPQGVTAGEAGRIVHSTRNDACVTRLQLDPLAACCRWAASDGWDALKRLRARELVDQEHDRGPYRIREAL